MVNDAQYAFVILVSHVVHLPQGNVNIFPPAFLIKWSFPLVAVCEIAMYCHCYFEVHSFLLPLICRQFLMKACWRLPHAFLCLLRSLWGCFLHCVRMCLVFIIFTCCHILASQHECQLDYNVKSLCWPLDGKRSLKASIVEHGCGLHLAALFLTPIPHFRCEA